jgi:pantothenate kinase
MIAVCPGRDIVSMHCAATLCSVSRNFCMPPFSSSVHLFRKSRVQISTRTQAVLTEGLLVLDFPAV